MCFLGQEIENFGRFHHQKRHFWDDRIFVTHFSFEVCPHYLFLFDQSAQKALNVERKKEKNTPGTKVGKKQKKHTKISFHIFFYRSLLVGSKYEISILGIPEVGEKL